MASPTELVITLVAGSSPSSVTVSIPQSLLSLDSGQTTVSQTGFSAVDQLIRSIFRAGVFTDGAGAWLSDDANYKNRRTVNNDTH